MNNKERLNEILIIRELRRELGSFKNSNEEKALILKALNDYEARLQLDIRESINNKDILEGMNIESDIDVVSVPIDENRPNYPELYIPETPDITKKNINILEGLLINADLENISMDFKKVFLKSLKEYCRSLQELQLKRKSLQESIPELYQNSKK